MAAGLLLTGTLGSVHAFSVFVSSMEVIHSASRASVSLVYSLALIALTVAVLSSHLLFRRFSPSRLAAAAGLLSAGGLLLAAKGPGMASLYLGYGVVFGFANGLGYALALQLAAHALPARRGAAMGAVTAVYALGAMIFANLFVRILDLEGPLPPGPDELTPRVELALLSLASVLAPIALLAGLLCAKSGIFITQSQGPAEGEEARSNPGKVQRLTILLWFGYGLGCLAGLMAIGHAAGIVGANGGSVGLMAWGVTLIALGNALGGFIAGPLADRLAPRTLLAALSFLSSLALVGLAIATQPGAVLAGLSLVGLSYGAIIAVYPAATTHFVGLADSARVYGLIFTAWGAAGLLGPWIAGLLFDLRGTYDAALLIAAAAGLLSAVAARLLPAEAG